MIYNVILLVCRLCRIQINCLYKEMVICRMQRTSKLQYNVECGDEVTWIMVILTLIYSLTQRANLRQYGLFHYIQLGQQLKEKGRKRIAFSIDCSKLSEQISCQQKMEIEFKYCKQNRLILLWHHLSYIIIISLSHFPFISFLFYFRWATNI